MPAHHRAIVCKDKGGWQSLTLDPTWETPTPSTGEVLVKVDAAGVNFPDALICEGKYQFQPPYPFVPGGEVAGTIVQVGPGVKKWKQGDRVAALTGWGGFQEYIVVAQEKCISVGSMPSEVAAGFIMTYGTGIHALRDRGELKAGDWCLILGASGGVGVAAIELSKAMGAKVIACASSDDKLQLCKKFGADYVINYSTENLKARVAEITQNHGADVCYDAVGGVHAEPALRSMAWRGRYLVVGFVGGIPKIPLNLTLLKGCSIVGVFWGSFAGREPEAFDDDVKTLMKWYAEGKLKPSTTQSFALQDTPLAISQLAERKVLGKIVVVMDKKPSKM